MRGNLTASRPGACSSAIRFLSVLMLAGAAACADYNGMGKSNQSLWDGADGDLQRRVITADWDTLAAYAGGDRDTLLTYPHRLAAHKEGVYVFDDGARRLISFDANLEVLATAGGRGAGPFEFNNVRDLVVTATGDAALLDRGNGRITTIGMRGAQQSMIPVRDVAGPEQMVVLDPNRYVLYATGNRRTPFVVIDSLGNPAEKIAFPWRGYQNLSSLSSDGRLARDPEQPETWAFVFVRGNGWFAFDTLQPRDSPGRFVEHTEFPVPLKVDHGFQLRANTPISGLDSAISENTLFVLFGGTDPNTAYMYIDQFDLSDGNYLGSFRLPQPALAISVSDGTFYVLFQEPHPSVYRLRPRV